MGDARSKRLRRRASTRLGVAPRPMPGRHAMWTPKPGPRPLSSPSLASWPPLRASVGRRKLNVRRQFRRPFAAVGALSSSVSPWATAPRLATSAWTRTASAAQTAKSRQSSKAGMRSTNKGCLTLSTFSCSAIRRLRRRLSWAKSAMMFESLRSWELAQTSRDRLIAAPARCAAQDLVAPSRHRH